VFICATVLSPFSLIARRVLPRQWIQVLLVWNYHI